MARVALLLLALVACAWFALGVRQAVRTEGARAIVVHVPVPPPARLDRAAALLRDAGWLNPDAEVDLLRARLALDRRDLRGAARILAGVVRREPSNVEAWAGLALVARRYDARTYRRASAEVRRLAPPVRAR